MAALGDAVAGIERAERGVVGRHGGGGEDRVVDDLGAGHRGPARLAIAAEIEAPPQAIEVAETGDAEILPAQLPLGEPGQREQAAEGELVEHRQVAAWAEAAVERAEQGMAPAGEELAELEGDLGVLDLGS